MPKKEVLQGGGIIVYGDRIVLRRTKKGKWIFPKGHIEPGETAADTARRESEEETGLLVEIVNTAGSIRFKTPEQKVEVEYFLLRATGPGPAWPKHENIDTFLVPLEQVSAHLSFGKLRRVWDEVEDRVRALLPPASA